MSAEELWIELPAAPQRRVPLMIAAGSRARLGELLDASVSTVAVITDVDVAPLWLDEVRSLAGVATETVVLPAGERAKHPATLEAVWRRLLEVGADRDSVVVNLGGGVIGDLGGFAAATYMRGVRFIQMPTTLLAQVDASVGGKVGVDVAGVKNLAGVFAQPLAVIVDTEFLDTLPERQYRAGFAEIIKHGLIRDARYFHDLDPAVLGHPASSALPPVIRRSCEIKAAVVAADEREGGVRRILNFGHTVGHAVESLFLEGPAPLLHGEAVAVGMVAAARISHEVGLLGAEALAAVEDKLVGFGLPTRLPATATADADDDAEAILALTRQDKKQSAGRIRWTLLESVGAAIHDQDVDPGLVADVLRGMR